MTVPYHDYYQVLGVERTATDKQIKTAYRKLAREWHPDLRTQEEKTTAEEKFKEINEAYEVLSDPEKRAKYDQLGANWQNGEQFHASPGYDYNTVYNDTGQGEFSDFFEMIFGQAAPHYDSKFGARYGSRFGATYETGYGPLKGQDIETELLLTLEEAYHGGKKTLQLSVEEAGSASTQKTIEVKIPAGVHDGSRIRLKAQGGQGYNGGAKGDLYFNVRIQPHDRFKVEGNNIEVELILRPEQAVLGDQVPVPTLDGIVNLRVPPGTGNGKRLRLRGKGLPAQGGRGDQYVIVRVDIPAGISSNEEELYRQIALLRKSA